MDYFYLVLMILVLVGLVVLLNRMDKRTKNKHKKEAYELLDAPDATPDAIKKNIKMLRLYGGRWKKDKEFIQLIDKLIAKLDKIDPRQERI